MSTGKFTDGSEMLQCLHRQGQVVLQDWDSLTLKMQAVCFDETLFPTYEIRQQHSHSSSSVNVLVLVVLCSKSNKMDSGSCD